MAASEKPHYRDRRPGKGRLWAVLDKREMQRLRHGHMSMAVGLGSNQQSAAICMNDRYVVEKSQMYVTFYSLMAGDVSWGLEC